MKNEKLIWRKNTLKPIDDLPRRGEEYEAKSQFLKRIPFL
uniref:Uncharacterized protein n=1 Tax=Lepeophtheirus salmonis TaxID=72036 RepID=A0A0K2TMT1_LEPSM